MSSPILRLQAVSKSFGDSQILHNISCDIMQGEIFGIIGPSGSGKTTLLHTLIGFLQPTHGEVKLHIADVKGSGVTIGSNQKDGLSSLLSNQVQAKQMMGFASQEPSFYPELTLYENLDLFATLHDLSIHAKKANIDALLELMELTSFKDKFAGKMSGGMAKRLDVACALIHKPSILILDEPTADLDPHLRHHMWDAIKKINAQGTTIILSSHFLDELEQVCDRVGVLWGGKFRHIGSPKELEQMFDDTKQIHFETLNATYQKYASYLQKKHPNNIKKIINHKYSLHVHTSSPQRVLNDILEIIKKSDDILLDIYVEKPKLSDLFEHMSRNEVQL